MLMRLPFLTTLLLTSALAVSLFACTSTAPPGKLTYDLGPVLSVPAVSRQAELRIAFADISTPAALDSEAMWYRLLYDNPQQARAYAQHRWSMTPAALLTQSLSLNFASQGGQVLHSSEADASTPVLKIELVEFAQLFPSPSVSSAQISLRASLFVNSHLLAQRYFSQNVAADSADAPAGARAMAHASSALGTALYEWMKQQLPSA
jgi:cholesterol transport system auxiliary component